MNPSAAAQAIQQFQQMKNGQLQQQFPNMNPQVGLGSSQDIATMQAMQAMQQQLPQQGMGGQLPQGPVQPMNGMSPDNAITQQLIQQGKIPPGAAENQLQGGQQQSNPLLQHPAVQQALQSVGQFLGKIGHPLAGIFNQLHGQGVGMPQSIIDATKGNQPPASYQNATNIGNLGGGAPISMQQLGQAMGRK